MSDRLNFDRWLCEPLGCGQSHVITTCNDDIVESLRGLELINGKIVEMIKNQMMNIMLNLRICEYIRWLSTFSVVMIVNDLICRGFLFK